MPEKHPDGYGYLPPPCTAYQLGTPGQRMCKCNNAFQAALCMTGHMTECHYPLDCEVAECAHWRHAQEPPEEEVD